MFPQETVTGTISTRPIQDYLKDAAITGDGFAATSPIIGPVPTGSYLAGVSDCLEICEQELGLTTAGSAESDAIAKVIKRIQGELI